MLYRCSWTRCLLNLPDFSYFAENVVTFYALTSLRCNCAQKPIQKRDEQNKCIGDDTKAAARQSPICIKKQKKNKIWRKTICNMADGIITPCNVARSWHCDYVIRSSEIMTWIRQMAAPCNMADGSGVTCHWILPNVRHIIILHLVSISTISPQSTCHSAPVCEILSKSDHPRQKKWRHVDFQDGRSQPSLILEVQ